MRQVLFQSDCGVFISKKVFLVKVLALPQLFATANDAAHDQNENDAQYDRRPSQRKLTISRVKEPLGERFLLI
jgi:hypothetical protein